MKNEATNAPDTEGRAPMADDGQVSGSDRLMLVLLVVALIRRYS